MVMRNSKLLYKKLISWSVSFNSFRKRDRIKGKYKKILRRKKTLWTTPTRCTNHFNSKMKISHFRSNKSSGGLKTYRTKTKNLNKCTLRKYRLFNREEEFCKNNLNWRILLSIILFLQSISSLSMIRSSLKKRWMTGFCQILISQVTLSDTKILNSLMKTMSWLSRMLKKWNSISLSNSNLILILTYITLTQKKGL